LLGAGGVVRGATRSEAGRSPLGDGCAPQGGLESLPPEVFALAWNSAAVKHLSNLGHHLVAG
jgi:hypothetical protein